MACLYHNSLNTNNYNLNLLHTTELSIYTSQFLRKYRLVNYLDYYTKRGLDYFL